MQNNYTTNNYYQAAGVSSSLIHFEKPRLALVKGILYKLYGMLLITSIEKNKKNGGMEISTYRQPLAGENFNPIDIISEYDDCSLIFLPENGIIDEKIMKTLFNQAKEQSNVFQLVDDLKKENVIFKPKSEQLAVELYYLPNKTLEVTSDAFGLYMENLEKEKMKDLSPSDFMELFVLGGYMKIKYVFQVDEKEDKEVKQVAGQLKNWFDIHEKIGILYDNNNIYTCHDGEYIYTENLGKIRMTREEFLEKFPRAKKL